MLYKCDTCVYQTDRKNNYERHINGVLHKKRVERKGVINAKKGVIKEEEGVYIEKNGVVLEGVGGLEVKNEILEVNKCKKCNKEYKNQKTKEKHEQTCKGINNLTCPKCCKVFTDRHNKYRHCKNSNCKPRSVFTTSTIENKEELVRNFGDERRDFITLEELVPILKCCLTKVIPTYISHKNFNKQYPENHNMKFVKNQYIIKQNDEWNTIQADELADKLYLRNSIELGSIFHNNQEAIEELVKNTDHIANIKENLDFPYIGATGKDKKIKKLIKDNIKIGTRVVINVNNINNNYNDCYNNSINIGK